MWAGAGIVFRRLKGRVRPGAMNFGKNLSAATFFVLLLLVVTGAPWPRDLRLDATLALVASGVVGLSVCDTFFLRAILEIGPRKATLIMAGLAPGLVFVGAFFPPFSQHASAFGVRPWIGFTMALCGVALASSETPDGAHDPAEGKRGFRNGILAAIFQAIGVLLARYAFQQGAAPIEGASVRLIAGTGGLVVAALVFGRARAWAVSLSAKGVMRTLAIAAFFGTFIGIGLNQCDLAWAESTSAATTINSLSPV